ncbi:hypothetical protein [Nostoc sp. JL31]|uniref:hypothetical protein n=1 Tax=Nostoc sp. JL31 TaxID=2815395 RepID=UPI0025FC5E92|nr:hypothetical protein [Nostoc sp. JL31]
MMLTHGDAPSAEHIPAGWHDKIMHVCLDLGDRLLMGSDSPPGYFETPQGFYGHIWEIIYMEPSAINQG